MWYLQKNVFFYFKKMFTNELNVGLPRGVWVEKTVYGVQTHWLSGTEKILDEAASKQDDTENLLGHRRINQYSVWLGFMAYQPLWVV